MRRIELLQILSCDLKRILKIYHVVLIANIMLVFRLEMGCLWQVVVNVESD